jgi:hypothetical protein
MKYLEKTDGQGGTFLVPNPDYYLEVMPKVKVRFKPTNVKPKKKKRKNN